MTDTDTARAVIVTDAGFARDDRSGAFVAPEALNAAPAAASVAVELAPDAAPEALVAAFDRIDLIRIRFATFSDGRGFTLARQLRRLGYRGRLRAAGHVISDQFRLARQSGFDEVEIPHDLAARQPVDHWLRGASGAGAYQRRLGVARPGG